MVDDEARCPYCEDESLECRHLVVLIDQSFREFSGPQWTRVISPGVSVLDKAAGALARALESATPLSRKRVEKRLRELDLAELIEELETNLGGYPEDLSIRLCYDEFDRYLGDLIERVSDNAGINFHEEGGPGMSSVCVGYWDEDPRKVALAAREVLREHTMQLRALTASLKPPKKSRRAPARARP